MLAVQEAPLKIGDVARLAELSIDTVRYYEREGLLGRVRRSAGGQREYDTDAVRRLSFVRRATALGFSLAEVKALLSLRVSTRTSCVRVRERALSKVVDIDQRIAELQAMRDALARLARNCDEPSATGSCPILDELSRPLDAGTPTQPTATQPS
ncbi:MAG: heavy metal-responsive transcriptional regulator [Kofleriaceae bacterium]|nr:heavy metal-responsive transcriptional regulator [Kofleriaceae bacterium]